MQDIIKLPVDFQVSINHSFTQKKFKESTKVHIEDIWKKELIRTEDKLFNGQILSAEEFDGKQLIGHFVEYKQYLAQLRDPSLADELNIKPICVCGHTTAGDYILIGLRSNYVTDYANYFELVPAGGIDPLAIINNRIDIRKQIQIELKEESGIEASMVQSIVPTFIIQYMESCTYEIVSKIELDPAARNWVGERDGEYTEIMWIAKRDVKAFVEQHRKQMIPLSIQILDLFANTQQS